MEIQREDVNVPEEKVVRKNRIRFYTMLGARLLEGVNYLLPPTQNDNVPEKMYLMIRPDLPYLSKVSIVGYIRIPYILHYISISIARTFWTTFHRNCLHE